MPNFLLPPPAHDPLAGDQIIVSYNFEWYKFVAYAVRQIIPAQFWDTPPSDIGDEVDTLVYLLGKPMQVDYPTRLLLFPAQAHIILGNAMTWASVPTSRFAGIWHQNVAAQNDELEYLFQIKAGAYHLHVFGRTASSQGIVTWKLDGVTLGGTDDYYSGTTIENVEHVIAMTVLTDGSHTLNGKVATKNGSSSGYDKQTSYLTIVP